MELPGSPNANLPGLSAGPMTTLTQGIERLTKAIEGNPDSLDVAAHTKMLDEASTTLMAVAGMIEHRGTHARIHAARSTATMEAASKGGHNLTARQSVEQDCGYKSITRVGLANLYSRFVEADVTHAESLSGTEVTRYAPSTRSRVFCVSSSPPLNGARCASLARTA